MLLGEDFFFPLGSTKALSPQSDPTSMFYRNSAMPVGTIQQHTTNNNGSKRILGFDAFALRSTRHDGAASEEQQQRLSTTTEESSVESTNSGFFPAPGLTWKNSPLSNNLGGQPPFVASSTSAANLSFARSNNSVDSNGGVRLLRLSSPLLPAWFPWIPTKSQIMSLKLTELKEACSQRGLFKTGNKNVLQDRLWEWTTEHQIQHQARLNGDFLTNWFEEDSNFEEPDALLLERRKQQREEERNNKETHNNSMDDATNKSRTPNSLAEWSRSVDTEKFKQKRQEIHRQKRIGKKTNASNNNRHDHVDSVAATKEYLRKLSNAMKSSPSSPYASNKDTRELYEASKKADQLGEPELAIELLESLLEITPKDARLYRRLSRMHNDQGNADIARATLQKGLRLLPHNAWLWHGMGQLELSKGRTDYAIRCFQRAIKEDPAFAHSYHAWGIHEFSNGQIAKAMKIFKKGIEYSPTNHRLHHALGDLYRGAKLMEDAERSYKRALAEGPEVSHGFALSALACVAYEQGKVDEARRWLYRSIENNNGRHAQGWLALAQLEEAEGNVEKALTVCEASIIRYEHGLIAARNRYKRGSYRNRNATAKDWKSKRQISSSEDHERFQDPTATSEVQKGLLKSIPRYRSGDKFLGVFRHWARLEGRYGSFDGANRVYERASAAFPWNHQISLDWARYHAKLRNVGKARSLYGEACNRASSHHADPYREYAAFEMSLGEFEQARTILFKGAQAVTRSSSEDHHRSLGLAQLYVTWAVCEWHLGDIPRVEVLFDHALRLTNAGSKEASELRSFVLFLMAQLEYYEREEYYLAQHCIGLLLKENSMPGGNLASVWKLWAKVARELGNAKMEEECSREAKRCYLHRRRMLEGDGSATSATSALDTMNMLKGSQNLKILMRQQPWHDKLQALRGQREGSDVHDSTTAFGAFSDFYSSIRIPKKRIMNRNTSKWETGKEVEKEAEIPMEEVATEAATSEVTNSL